MNLPYMVNRLEIAFWTTLVAVLQDRRTSSRTMHIILAVLAGLILLLALAWVRFSANPVVSSAPDPAVHLPSRPANGQNNLLVILVDSLDAREPVLQSVWVLGRVPSVPQVALMPIYPALPDEKLPDPQAAFPSTFVPDQNSTLPAEFSNALKSRGLWWDHFLVIDHAGLVRMVDLMGGLELDGRQYDGRQVVAQLPDPVKDPQTARSIHLKLVQQLCFQSMDLPAKVSGEATAAFSRRALSDLPAERLQTTLRGLQSTGGIACNFPTLSGR